MLAQKHKEILQNYVSYIKPLYLESKNVLGLLSNHLTLENFTLVHM